MTISRIEKIDDDHMLWIDQSNDCTYAVNNDDMDRCKAAEKPLTYVLKFTPDTEVYNFRGDRVAKIYLNSQMMWEIRSDLNLEVSQQSFEDFDGIYKLEVSFAKLYIEKMKSQCV